MEIMMAQKKAPVKNPLDTIRKFLKDAGIKYRTRQSTVTGETVVCPVFDPKYAAWGDKAYFYRSDYNPNGVVGSSNTDAPGSGISFESPDEAWADYTGTFDWSFGKR